MTPLRRSLLIAAAMTGAAAAAAGARVLLGDGRKAQPPQLQRIVPAQFGAWREQVVASGVVSARTEELLASIYSEVLSRVYGADDGYRVMLSVAYGGDQRGALRAHKPEICYPAQGFKLVDASDAVLDTAHGPIATRLLRTSLGSRHEPVMYWFAQGGRTDASVWQRRAQNLRLALTGQLPDGLLFRVSSIDGDAPRAWQRQGDFVRALLDACTPSARARLAGLDAVA
jgi:EpsI family protein